MHFDWYYFVQADQPTRYSPYSPEQVRMLDETYIFGRKVGGKGGLEQNETRCGGMLMRCPFLGDDVC